MFGALLSALKAQFEPLLDSEVHALAGLAGGAYGFATGNWHDIAAGGGYAVLMKLAAALKSFATKPSTTLVQAAPVAPKTTMQAGA